MPKSCIVAKACRDRGIPVRKARILGVMATDYKGIPIIRKSRFETVIEVVQNHPDWVRWALKRC